MRLDKIAYIAPEIPSVSATFVYNELLALQEKGLQIIPISVHKVNINSQNADLEDLAQRTFYLYLQSWQNTFYKNIKMLLRKPKQYFRTFFLLVHDLFFSQAPAIEKLKLIYHFLQASSIAHLLIKTSCQHIHIHFAHVPTQIGMYASALSEIPFTFTAHANDLFERGFFLKQKVARSVATITISEYNKIFLINQGAPPEKIKIVRCGVDSEQYNYVGNQGNNYPLRIGTLGRLVPKKGVNTLILALSELWKKGIDFRLEIGGDGQLRKSLEELVSTHALESKVTFLGTMDFEEVFLWMQQLDIFVLACKQDSKGDQDGIPVVLMEAMATGIPVVSTKISGVPELIEDGVSGFLAQPDNPKDLAVAIEKVMESSDLVCEITKVARKKIKEEFEQKLNVDRLLEVFKACHT